MILTRRPWLLIAIPAAIYLLGMFVLGGWIVDDAGISFAYARNLAAGDGMVSQAGRVPVEGFSDPLWVLLLVPTYWLGLFDPVLTPKLLGAGCVLAAMVLLQRTLERRTSSPWPGFVASIALALSPPIVIWSVSGLENGLYLLLAVLLYIQLVERGRRWEIYAGACTAGLALTRPDGLIFVFAGIAVCLLEQRAELDLRARARSAATFAGAFVVCAGPYWTYRLVALGRFWPHPYYAKRTTTSFAARLGDLVGHLAALFHKLADLGRALAGPLGVPLLVATIVALVILARRKRFTAELRVAVVLQIVAVGAYLVLDEDWMREYRFATVAIAMCVVTAVLAAYALFAEARRVTLAWAVIGAIALASFAPRLARFAANPTTPYASVEREAQRFNIYADTLGLQKASILVADLGGQLMRSRLTVYDAAGLCEPEVIRTLKRGGERWHYDHPEFADWVFEKIKPTFISTHRFWSNVTALEYDPRFMRDYVAIDAYRDEYVIRMFQRFVRSGDFVRRDALGADPSALARLQALTFSSPPAPFAVRLGERLGILDAGDDASPTELVATARTHRTRGYDGEPDPNRAVTLLRRALARPDADRAIVLFELAVALDAAMRNTEARAVWRELSGLTPAGTPFATQLAARLETEGVGALVQRGLEQYTAKKYADVLATSDVALFLDPQSRLALTNKCAALNALERWDDAVPVCEQALAVQPTVEMAKNNLAWARSKRDVGRLVARSLAQYEAKQFTDAIASSREALRLDPASGPAATNLCASLCAAEQWTEAVTVCAQGAAAHPDLPLLQNNLQWARNGAAAANLVSQSLEAYNAKNFPLVIEHSRAAIALDPRSAAAWNNQCAALCSLTRWEEALPVCEQAVRVAPASQLAHANLAWARSRR